MANTLTGFIPTIHEAVDTVSRELVGFIPSVTLNATAEQVAKDQSINYPIVDAYTASDITPSNTSPDAGDTSFSYGTMSISKSRKVAFDWTGEEQTSVGGLYQRLLADQFAQAMRTLINEVETDIANLYTYASRAYGTAGTTPFASTLAGTAQMLKILADNGAPQNELQLVINTAAGANLRTLAQLTKANEAADTSLLRRGVLLDIHGFKIRESAQVKAHTKGTGASYQVNNASTIAVGGTTVAADTGSGTVLAGDVVTFAADTNNKYVVNTALSAGSFVINKPGIRGSAIPDNNAITVGDSYSANMAFHRGAIHLLARVPKMPQGSSAADVYEATDPISGITFQIAMYPQYRQTMYEVALAWGVKAVKPEHMGILLG